MAQPDPLQIANHLHAAADQIGLFTTLSADSKASILQRILDDIERFRSDITRLESKLAIVDHNTQARLYNAFITSRQTPLDAMKTLADTVPASFPINTAQLATMSATQLLTLSRAYNLPENGTVDEQRSRFRRFIGVVRTV